MAGSPAQAITSLLPGWASLLAGLADPALLLDRDERLLGGTRAARRLLGSSLELPGTPARALLGLPAQAPLDGELELRPPASGLTLRSTLRRTALFGPQGELAGCLLLLVVPSDEQPEPRVESLEGRLREVALTISSALEIGQVLDQVVRLSIELFGAAGGTLPLYEAQFERLLPAHVIGLDGLVLSKPIYRGTGAIWSLIDSGEPFLHNEYQSDPRALKILVDCGVRAVMAVPVLAGTQLLGVLNLYHTSPERHFSWRDLELLETIGRQAGVALQNAYRYQESLREAERRFLLYKASVAFGAALAPEQLYLTIHRTLIQLMPCDTIAITSYDHTTRRSDYLYLADWGGRVLHERAPAEDDLLGFVARSGLAMRVNGTGAVVEELFGAEPFGAATTLGSLLAVPLQVGEQTIGAISVQAMAAGAYSASDLDTLESLAVTAAIAMQNAHLFAQVQELATLDPLTGVSNRRHFFELARRELERAARYGRPLSMLMLDADHFKQVNDRYGHVAGDEVLRTIAARCRASLREADLIGRYGGEEFLILLPETAAPQALQVADRLRDAVGAEPVPTLAGPVTVQISIGVASLGPGEQGAVETLLDQADRALYGAKAAGRNQSRAS